jgi:hypothetical protein
MIFVEDTQLPSAGPCMGTMVYPGATWGAQLYTHIANMPTGGRG